MNTPEKFRRIDLLTLYHKLFEFFGPQHWWPADSPFEVIIGTILTQNTAWKNVETAINTLKNKNLLTPVQLENLSHAELSESIRSSGYYNQKALKIKAFLKFFKYKYNYKLSGMAQAPLEELRKQLLEVHGIGEETADSILLYAVNKPTFVVDAYTRRILSRMGYLPEKVTYANVKSFCESSLTKDVALYNEFHALFVRACHDICLSKPKCTICPVKIFCQYYQYNGDNMK